VRGIAEDLGIERGTLRGWLDRLGTGRKTAADGTPAPSPLAARPPRRPRAGGGPAGVGGVGNQVGGPETPEQRLARLEAENTALRAEHAKLVIEREILRQAAKYSPGRRTGEPLPVRRRPHRHLRPSRVEREAAVRAAGGAAFVVLRLARRRPGPGRTRSSRRGTRRADPRSARRRHHLRAAEDHRANGGCTGTTYTVGSDGRFTATIGSNDTVALYVGAKGGGEQPGDNAATVYYSTEKNWSAYNLHYAPTGGTWTTSPGVAMEAACAGWVKKSVLLGTATGLKAAFNNGSGTWDNNNSADYTLGTGNVTVKGGVIGTGNPCGDDQPSETGAAFAVNATTVPGQNIYVVGNIPALGSWAPAAALKLDPAAYPVWKLTARLPAGTSFEYKYIRKDAAGNVTWESGANRTATVPVSGSITLNDTWRS
jgi:transposase-like protein